MTQPFEIPEQLQELTERISSRRVGLQSAHGRHGEIDWYVDGGDAI